MREKKTKLDREGASSSFPLIYLEASLPAVQKKYNALVIHSRDVFISTLDIFQTLLSDIFVRQYLNWWFRRKCFWFINENKDHIIPCTRKHSLFTARFKTLETFIIFFWFFLNLPKHVGTLVLQIADASWHIQIAAVDACGVVGAGAGDGLHLHPPVLDGVVLFTAVRHLPAVHLPSWNKSSKWFSLNIFFPFFFWYWRSMWQQHQNHFTHSAPFEPFFGGDFFFSHVINLYVEWKLSA